MFPPLEGKGETTRGLEGCSRYWSGELVSLRLDLLLLQQSTLLLTSKTRITRYDPLFTHGPSLESVIRLSLEILTFLR